MLVSCNEENYNEGFTVKTPERPTASATNSDLEATAAPTGSVGSVETAVPTSTPTMNASEFGNEVLLPTPPPETDSDETSSSVTGTLQTENTPSAGTATATQSPVVQVTPAERTGIMLPPIWF